MNPSIASRFTRSPTKFYAAFCRLNVNCKPSGSGQNCKLDRHDSYRVDSRIMDHSKGSTAPDGGPVSSTGQALCPMWRAVCGGLGTLPPCKDSRGCSHRGCCYLHFTPTLALPHQGGGNFLLPSPSIPLPKGEGREGFLPGERKVPLTPTLSRREGESGKL